jgi:peptidoglycan/LPS O-acetylase OafA/YrhL
MYRTSTFRIITLLGKKPVKAKPGETIIFLEYFRIYAFIAVFISHKFPKLSTINLNDSNPVTHIINLIYNAFMPTLTNGEGGVVIFFFISGYIIANKIDQEKPLEFLIKRIFRIYPLYIFASLALTWLFYHSILPWHLLWPQLTLMGDFIGIPGALAVEWTLRIEVVFYLFALVLACLPALAQRYRLIIAVLNLAAVICVIMPAFPNWSPNTIGKFNQFFPFLLVGMGLYYYDIKKTSLWPVLPVILIALAELGGAPMPLLMFFLFFNIMLVRHKIPSYRWISWISSITYSFYLFHLWLFDYFFQHFSRGGWNLPHPTLDTLAALILSCYAAHYVIEKPFIWLGRRAATGTETILAHGLARLRKRHPLTSNQPKTP